jgi:hypothetical protein
VFKSKDTNSIGLKGLIKKQTSLSNFGSLTRMLTCAERIYWGRWGGPSSAPPLRSTAWRLSAFPKGRLPNVYKWAWNVLLKVYCSLNMHHLIWDRLQEGGPVSPCKPPTEPPTPGQLCTDKAYLWLLLSLCSKPHGPPLVQRQPGNSKRPPGTPGSAGWWCGKLTGLELQSFPWE